MIMMMHQIDQPGCVDVMYEHVPAGKLHGTHAQYVPALAHAQHQKAAKSASQVATPTKKVRSEPEAACSLYTLLEPCTEAAEALAEQRWEGKGWGHEARATLLESFRRALVSSHRPPFFASPTSAFSLHLHWLFCTG